MKNKYSLENILIEGWGDDYGKDWGTPSRVSKFDGIAATAGFVDGYQAPLGQWAGFGYEGEDRIFTSVHDYENDYSGEWAEEQDNPRAAGFSLDDMSAKATALTFGASRPGNTFTGDYANYKTPVAKMIRNPELKSRRLSDILPTEAEDGPFTKALRPRSLGNVYKHFKKL